MPRRSSPAESDGRPADGVVPGALPPTAIDDTDREILRVLQVDGRTSNTEIARRLGVTETTVRKRLAALLEADLVQIVAVPTPRLAGLTVSAIMGISVQLNALQKVADALVERPEVRYCGVSAGRYDLILESFFTDHEHVVRFSTDVLGRMEGITDVETSLILKTEKFSYEWEIP
ncbi:Lrp/AsnC family transcriptional regulator [Geodermatophilus sabuli]|uniref:Transcriptional regulator, AsnC family n=1 Tax=Geodermatophilus sabuli TaxID=1564158 RepID=A0A285EDK1_9ACTN|nr:Lrp/AsnC family transcriptional regulator [Geodermatophilus sabuli]MBB3084617.1 Lrp/AsnC family transcriptional regulator for asnA, asnC and gidA [Geodermatophilus sabuli]SNX97189.1 transcriptional regulator, AsnC family [Geodermatophilus sabuli]